MECPICGQKLEDNAAFCTNCGGSLVSNKDGSLPPPEPEKPPKKVAERLYPPQEKPEASQAPEDPIAKPSAPEPPNASEAPTHPAHPRASKPDSPPAHPKASKPDRASEQRGKRLKVLTAISLCAAILAIAVSAYIMVSTYSLRTQLNMAQKESTSATANADKLKSQVAELTEELDTARADSKSLGAQVAELQRQISDMETSVNQSQYDKETAQRTLEEAKTQLSSAQEENTALSAQLDETQQSLEEVEQEKDELAEENSALKQQVDGYASELDFYDSYVVFVMLSSSDKYYHKYDCSNFTKRNFLAYSTKLAEASGYSPCPVCIGTE